MMNSSQRLARHVIINDSTINTNILMKHHMLVHNTSLWHKLYVTNCENMEKKVLLKIIMDELHPNDFIPVNFAIEDNSFTFLIKNCAAAIKQICAQNLIVRNSVNPERPLKFSIILGFASTQEIKVNMEDKISQVIKKRFNTETKVLNLDAFYKDIDLEEFCPLSQPKILLFVLHMCKNYPFLTLRLSNNEIRTLNALDALISLKISFGLDLRNNLIAKEDDLSVLSSILVSEIVLDGNPICENINETSYVKMVKSFCPDVKKIDGISVWNGFLPHRRNFLCNPEGRELIDNFLEHYFTLYDTPNRNYLENIYHPNALFTLSCHYISGQQSSLNIRLMSYKKYSRNIKFMSNLSKCDEFVFKGPKKIIQILSDLPLSEHDPYSFTVDLLYYTETCVIFVLTGVFREPAQNLADTERYLGFVRTFVLHPQSGGRYVIVNEELHVNNATTVQQNSSFKYTRVPGNVSILSSLEPNDEKEKIEIIKAMSCITTLNPQWAKKCLEDTNFNLKDSLALFVDLFKTDQIPNEAFRYDEETRTSTQSSTCDKGQSSLNVDNNSIIGSIDTKSDSGSKMDIELEPGEIIEEKDVKPVIDSYKIVLDDKNNYYSTQLKKISIARQNFNMHKAKDIATEIMIRHKEDSLGYKQLIQLHCETKDLISARYILQKAKMNLVRRKYTSVLKAYFSLELQHGSAEHLLTVIEKDMYNLKILDYGIDYLKALIKCKKEDKAKEFVKEHLRLLQSDPKIYSMLRELENSLNVKLH